MQLQAAKVQGKRDRPVRLVAEVEAAGQGRDRKAALADKAAAGAKGDKEVKAAVADPADQAAREAVLAAVQRISRR